MAKGNRPRSTNLYAAIIDAYRRKNDGDTSGLPSVKVSVSGPDDSYKQFKTTFRSLGTATRGSLRIDTRKSSLSSDGKTYSAVLSSYQPTEETREYMRKMRKKAK